MRSRLLFLVFVLHVLLVSGLGAQTVTFVDENGDAATTFLEGSTVFIRVETPSYSPSADYLDLTVSSLGSGDTETLQAWPSAPYGVVFLASIVLDPGGSVTADGVLQTAPIGGVRDQLVADYLSVQANASLVGSRLRFLDRHGFETTQIAIDEPLRLELVDHLADDPLVQDTATVLVYDPLWGPEWGDPVTLSETGLDTGVFTASYQPFGYVDDFVAQHDDSDALGTYSEAQVSVHGSVTTFRDAEGAPVATVVEGSTVTLEVTDSDADYGSDPFLPDTTDLSVLSLWTGDEEPVLLIETAAAQGTFVGTLPLAKGPAQPYDDLLQTGEDPGPPHSFDTLTATHLDVYGNSSAVVTTFGSRTWFAEKDGGALAGGYSDGESVYVRVEDHNANLSGLRDTTDVTLTSAVGDSETVILVEEGYDSGIFTGSIPVRFDNVSPESGTLEGALPYDESGELTASHQDESGYTASTATAPVWPRRLLFFDADGEPTTEIVDGVVRIRFVEWDDPPVNPDLELRSVIVKSLYSLDYETVELVETGLLSGVFEGKIPLSTGSPVTYNGVLETRDSGAPSHLDDEVRVEFQIPVDFATARVAAGKLLFLDAAGREAETYASSEPFRLRVVDRTANSSPTLVDTVTVDVTSAIDVETVTLTETGADTAVFEGSLPAGFSNQPGVPGDGTLAVVYFETVEAAYPGAAAPWLRAGVDIVEAHLEFVDAAGNPTDGYIFGEPIYVRATGFEDVSSPTLVDSLQMELSTSLGGDYETLALVETGTDTAVFLASIPSDLDDYPQGYSGVLELSRTAGPPAQSDLITAAVAGWPMRELTATAGTYGSRIELLDASGEPTTSYNYGETFYVRVEDQTVNSPYLDSVDVNVTLLPSGLSQNFELQETDAASNVFEGTIPWAVSGSEEVVVVYTDYLGVAENEARATIAWGTVEIVDGEGKPTSTVLLGGEVTVRVVALGANASPTSIDYVTIELTSELGADQETLQVPETGVDTGVFEISVGVDLAFRQWENGVLETAESLGPPHTYDAVTAFYPPSLAARADVVDSHVSFVNEAGNETGTYAAGSTVYVRAERYSSNPEPTVVEAISVDVSSASGDIETVTLYETGFDTNLFAGSLPIDGGTVSTFDGLLQAQAGELIEARHVGLAGDTALDQATVVGGVIAFLGDDGAPSGEVLAGGLVALRLIHSGANADPGTAEQVSADVTSLYAGDAAMVLLTETGADTGVFEGSLQLASPFETGLQTADSGTPFFHPEELTAAALGATATATVTDASLVLLDEFGRETTTFALEEPIRVRLVLPAADDPLAVDTASVEVASFPASDFETLVLTETGADTGVFEGSIPTSSAASPSDGFLNGDLGAILQATYTTGSQEIRTQGSILGSKLYFVDAAGQPAAVFMEGSTAYLRLIDPLGDFDPGSPDVSGVGVQSLLTGDRETAWLTETGPSTGLFEGSIRLGVQSSYSGDGVVRTSEDPGPPHRFDDIYASMEDENNPDLFVWTVATTASSIAAFIDAGGNDVAAYPAGATAYLRIEDHAANSDDFNPDVTSFLLSSLTSGDAETATLQETGADTGVFEGWVPLRTGAVALDDGTLQVAAGEWIELRHTDYFGYTEATDQAWIEPGPEVTITSPADGSSSIETDPVTLTGTAADGQGADLTAGIEWTSSLDGAIGTGGSVMTTALSVGTHTITASVLDSQGAWASDEITYTVLANAAPVVTITAPADGTVVLVGTSLDVSGSASDTEDGDLTAALTWTSSLDGAIGSGGSFSTAALSVGTHTITAAVTDSHGAPGSAAVTLTIHTAPSVTISAPADGASSVESDPVTFTGTASDAEDGDLTASITWTSSLDGTIGSGGSFSTAALSVGIHTITAAVTDSQGVPASAEITCTVNANTAPSVTITAPADGSVVLEGASVGFAGTASDTEDGDLTAALTWTSSLDGAIGSGGSFSTVALSIGTHTITATVTDSHGAPGSAAMTLTVNAAPTVTITAPADSSSSTETDPVTFTGTASDTEDGDLTATLSWTSSLDGAIGSGGSFSTAALSIGTHTITAAVTDSQGAPASAEITYTVDANAAPSVTITAPADGSVVLEGTSVGFAGTASDPEDGDLTASLSWTSSIDGAIGSGGSFSTATLSVGTHTITAAVTDSHGASGSTAVTLTVNAAPSVTITAPADGSASTETDPVTFTGTASDAEDGDLTASLTWTSSLDGTIGSGGSFVTSALSIGTHTITAAVTDSQGAPASASITYTVNANTAPSVTITAPANGSVVLEGTSVGFAGSASDTEDGDLTASLSWTSSLDGAIGSGGSFSTAALSVGTHTITASVTDSHGASGSTSVTLTINAAPSVTITAPANGSSSTETDPVTFAGTASDAEDGNLSASIGWTSSIDGAIGSGGSFVTSALSIGTHTITAAVTDSHGAPASASITYTVNANTAPVVTITAPADGSSFTLGDTVTFTGSALDVQDGDLSAALTWSSSLDGVLGAGSSLATSSLSLGSHTVTASVTDSHGATALASVTILIRPLPVQVTFAPVPDEDGRIRESAAGSGVGGTVDTGVKNNSALRIGDDNRDRQYKSFVSFDTSSIPDGAEIQAVTLQLVRGTVSGTDPFTTHGTCWVDVQDGGFGGSTFLESSDFEASATAVQAASMTQVFADLEVSEGVFDAAGLLAVNKLGTTQVRIYFAISADGDGSNDYAGFYSSANNDPGKYPQLVVTYQE